jgi:uncharacterized membrane protein
MAGVGFQLRRLLRGRSFTGIGLALVYGVALAAGPWLVTVATLVTLFFWVRPEFGLERFELLSSTIMAAFAGSLVISGPWAMLSTRHAADQLFLRRPDRIPAGLHASMLLSGGIAGLLGLGIVGWREWSDPPGQAVVFRLCAALLLVVLSLLWIVLGTVSYVRWYRGVAMAFAVSALISMGAAWAGRGVGLAGVLGGYGLGFVVLLALLYGIWRRRYGFGALWDPTVFTTFRRWAPIAAVGLFYQLGVWADKLVLWATRGRPVGNSPLRALIEYDVLTFLAYLSMVPVLAYFLIVVETVFFARYRVYLGRVRRGTLQTVWDAEAELGQALRRGFWRMAEYQLVTTGVLCLLAGPILELLHLSAWPTELFRWLLLAAGLQGLLLTVVLFLLYFELRWEAFWVTLIFCVGNALATAAVSGWPIERVACGYVFAVALALSLGLVWLEWRQRRLTVLRIAKQPVVQSHT